MIITVPNPVLTTPSKRIEKIDKKIRLIIARMKRELTQTDHPKGVGLAAPQIGVSLCIFITRPTEKSPIEVFLNPQITWSAKDLGEIERPQSDRQSLGKDKKLEGCLSIKNIWGYLKRPKKVKLRYLDEAGNIAEKEFEGFMATIIQHETDHLNGILFTQRVIAQKEKLYQTEIDENGKEKLVEIEI